MLASTPDTVVIAPSDDEENEDRLMITRFFIGAVGRPPMVGEENDMLRYVRWHPGVIDECVKRVEADALRRERAQVKIIELEARVREVQEERIKLHHAMKKQKKELEKLLAAQAEGRSKAAAVGPSGQRIQAAKRRLRVMRGGVASPTVTLQSRNCSGRYWRAPLPSLRSLSWETSWRGRISCSRSGASTPPASSPTSLSGSGLAGALAKMVEASSGGRPLTRGQHPPTRAGVLRSLRQDHPQAEAI